MRGYKASPGNNGGEPFDEDLMSQTVPDTVDWRLFGEIYSFYADTVKDFVVNSN